MPTPTPAWRVVASWSFDRLLWSPRTLAMTATAVLPAGLVLLYHALVAAGARLPLDGYGFFSLVTATVGFQFVAPMLALFYSGGVVADEVEAGTFTYIATRPVTRRSLLLGKLAASLAMELLLFVPALLLAYYLALAPEGWEALGRRFPALSRDLAAAVAGLSAYGGIFAAAGAYFRRPVLLGLGFVFVWEAVVAYVPGSLRRLTVAHYLHSLLPPETIAGGLAQIFAERTSVPAAVVALAAVIVSSHALALWLFSRREYLVRGG